MQFRTALNVVLHQTLSPDNLGAAARVLANFGLGRLILSDPGTFSLQDAEKLAIKDEAIDLLKTTRTVPDLPAALASSVYAVGTSMRTLDGRPPLTPEEAARRLVERSAHGPVALVFGSEKRGLSDAELSLCTDVCAIPTSPLQPSMNLAQAVAVMLYVCSTQVRELQAPADAPEPAKLGTIHALEKKMEEVLLASGFLNPQAPEHILQELMLTVSRMQLSQREAELWLTAFKQLGRGKY